MTNLNFSPKTETEPKKNAPIEAYHVAEIPLKEIDLGIIIKNNPTHHYLERAILNTVKQIGA